jgi:hypothetical protein
LSQCPNAPDPPTVTTCCRCGRSIVPEDEYARIDGADYCEDCIDDMPCCDLIPLLDGEWKTAKAGESIKCSDCGESIEAGDEYGVVDGEILCEACIDEIPYCDLVTRLGGDWNTASREDVYDGYDG